MSAVNGAGEETQNKRLVELATTIVAPITLATALLAYFGWIRGKSFYGYFGVNQGVLNLSVQDHLLRSTDVTLGAVLRLLAVGAALVAMDLLFRELGKTQKANGKKRLLPAFLAVCGLALITLGLLSALGFPDGSRLPPIFGAAILGVGAILVLRLGPTLLQRRASWSEHSRTVGLATTITTLAFAVFWALTLYAQDLGKQQAKNVDANPGKILPVATVFSKEFLDLPGSHVKASKIMMPGGDVRYRYTGLYLLTYSNDRWLLMTGKYPGNYRSSVVTLHDSEAVRVEVASLN